MRGVRFRPSPAMVIACIALFIAAGGAAYAASTIGTRDIKNRAVTRSKLARHAVSTSKLANGAVGTKQLKRDAVTGAKVAEDTLGQVPSAARSDQADQATNANQATNATHATNADHATSADSATNATTVGGMAVQKFSAKPPPSTALAHLVTVGTLDLQVGCDSNGNPLFTVAAANGAPPQGVRGSFDDGSGSSRTVAAGTLSPPDGLVVLNNTVASASGEINAATAGGAVTTVHWAARGATVLFPGGGNPDPNKCFFYGTAISG